MTKMHACPICSCLTDNDKYRPFCSKRCADIDLAHWFNGSYAVAAQELDDADYEELEKELNKNPEE